MTTGLVERLRWDPDRLDDPLAKEAADEIERLRQEYDQLQNKASDLYDELQALAEDSGNE